MQEKLVMTGDGSKFKTNIAKNQNFMQHEDKKNQQHEDENFKLQVGWSQDFSVNTHKHQLKVNINTFYKLQKV